MRLLRRPARANMTTVRRMVFTLASGDLVVEWARAILREVSVTIRARWRVGVGPIFVYECLTASRSWQGYAMRAGFLLVFLITLLVIWSGSPPVGGSSAIRGMAALGEWFYLGFVG